MPTAAPSFGARLAASLSSALSLSPFSALERGEGSGEGRQHAPPMPLIEKSSRAGPLIAFEHLRRPVWAPRDYQAFADEGFRQNAIVYRCVRMISECAAHVPLLLYDGDQEIEAHPLKDLIRRPNGHQSWPDFMQALVGYLLVSGNAYLEAVAAPDAQWASEGARIRELHLLRPDRMKVVPGPDGWPEAFDYTVAGRTVRIGGDVVEGVRSVLHVKLFHPTNDHYGLSPLEAAASAIDLHNTASRWNKALLDNSARPSGAIVYTARDGNLTGDQIERLKSELEAGFQGSANAGRPLLLEGGLDWKAMSLSPKDMDFLEARHAAAREIALALGVPPMLLGIPGDNTYSNLAEAQRTFWRATVLPLVERVANELSNWLGPADGRAIELRPDLDTLPALAGEREALWASLEKTSFLTTDEKRALAGFSPTPAEQKFNPNQPRIPAGNRTGGQWANGDGEDDGGDFGHTPDGTRVDPAAKKPRGSDPPPMGHNNPPVPLPVPMLPSGSTADTGGPGGGIPDFLQQKPGSASLTGDLEGLTPPERVFAQEMEALGNHVEIVPREDGTRTADLRINGQLYELKTVSGVLRTGPDGLSAAISSRIMDARGQSGDIIIDARRQQGMTGEIAERSIIRAYGTDNRLGARIQSITILTPQGVIHVPRR